MDKKTKDTLMNIAAEIVVVPLRLYAAGREAYKKLEESGKIDEAKDKFEEFKNSDQVKAAKEKWDTFADKAKEFGDNALDKAKEFGENAGEKAKEFGETAGEKAKEFGDAVEAKAKAFMDKMNESDEPVDEYAHIIDEVDPDIKDEDEGGQDE